MSARAHHPKVAGYLEKITADGHQSETSHDGNRMKPPISQLL